MTDIKHNDYYSSLKSIETENYLDRWLYRPVGFCIAKALCGTCITPNMVTVFSIFVGAAVGPLFYLNNLKINLLGIMLLVSANILDCVDGQLARLTGIKSKIGRILDGLAGDIWFTIIYVFLALRLKNEFGTYLFFIPAVISGFSHLIQANITDYYKTVHLFFISTKNADDLPRYINICKQYKEMRPGIEKCLFLVYKHYTCMQEKLTPELQLMLDALEKKFGADIPDSVRNGFRSQSRRLMKQLIDLMTFNGRTIVLIIAVITDYIWAYFIYEIVVLNIVLMISIHKHEKICKQITKISDEL